MREREEDAKAAGLLDKAMLLTEMVIVQGEDLGGKTRGLVLAMLFSRGSGVRQAELWD